MKIISFAQQKGGVGKSSAAINLACAAVASGKNVVVIDADVGQATALNWAERRESKGKPLVVAPKGGRLPEALAALDPSTDLVIIDLPGRDAPIVGAGLVAADLIIVPCRPLDIDIEASIATINNAARANRRYAYLMNIAQPNTMARAKEYAKALQDAGHQVAPIIVVQRIDVPDAIAAGSSAQETDPKGKSAQEFRELLAWINKETKGK